ncbi:MAG: hypothetical protein AAFO07_05270 [Bacteroidota bacterium]
MSRKKLLEGLESIFTDQPTDDLLQMDERMQSAASKGKTTSKAKPKKTTKKTTRSSSKNFSNELTLFLNEAFQESFDDQMAQQASDTNEKEKKDLVIKKRSRRPKGGLDGLIRNTIEPEKVTFSANRIKQITLALEEEKIQKLKEIARLEKKYLRKVINEIVEDFISDYQNNVK